MRKVGTIYLSDELIKRAERIRYYLIIGGRNIARVEGAEYCYLDKTTGRWVSDLFVFRHVSGIGGDADAKEITRSQARQWVSEHRLGVSVEWL